MIGRRLINASTAPILAACILSGAALAIADALTSPAAAAPALIVQFTTKGITMSKFSEEKIRRPGVAKLAASLAAKGMDRATAEASAKASLTGKVRIERVPYSDKVHAVPIGNALFIHGPQGCGKGRNADVLCRAFGKKRAVDFDDDTGMQQQDYDSDLIVFSNVPLPGSMSFSTAMSRVGIKA